MKDTTQPIRKIFSDSYSYLLVYSPFIALFYLGSFYCCYVLITTKTFEWGWLMIFIPSCFITYALTRLNYLYLYDNKLISKSAWSKKTCHEIAYKDIDKIVAGSLSNTGSVLWIHQNESKKIIKLHVGEQTSKEEIGKFFYERGLKVYIRDYDKKYSWNRWELYKKRGW